MKLLSEWTMQRTDGGAKYLCGALPVSMYQTLIKSGEITNPYYGENEIEMHRLSEHDYDFSTFFDVPEAEFSHEKVFLKFYGIDTLGEVFLNNTSLGTVNNMHRTYVYEVKKLLKPESNTLCVKLKSPIAYCEKRYAERNIYGVNITVDGYSYIRKAVFSMGWDWGPIMPDLGIWREVEIVGKDEAEIDGVYVVQSFSGDYKHLDLTAKIELSSYHNSPLTAEAVLKLSSGEELSETVGIIENAAAEFEIELPELWYPRGYGKQPLNTLTVTLRDGEKVLDVNTQTVGFRTLTISRDDEKGEFCFIANGLKIFSMGANYVPENQIFPFVTEEGTKKLLDDCESANYNTLRVWGGGVYPSDFFLDECDRRGIILWQDFMFACAAFLLDDEAKATIVPEFRDNIKRMRSHPSIGLWCGNNENETMWEYWGLPDDPETKEDYVEVFEKIIPEVLRELDPERFYWPSSPSSGGSLYSPDGTFKNSGSYSRGDQHYWAIWHGFKPIEEFRKYLFPFCSEYGFESIPEMKTVRSFAEQSDLNLNSPVMENHQKCDAGNEKLVYYIAQMCRYPYSFENLIYASQLVQSECIRSNVEHLRRNRGKCMGSLYWQVNDTNPIISWSSIDSFGRWKALHYAAKRFYAPIMVSCLEENVSEITLNIANERPYAVSGKLEWSLRNAKGQKLKFGEQSLTVLPLTSLNATTIDLSKQLTDNLSKRKHYLSYKFTPDSDTVTEGTALFVRPKSFEFIDPEIVMMIDERENEWALTFTAKAYAKGVLLTLSEADGLFSDNFFDLNGGESKEIILKKSDLSEPLTADMLKNQLQVKSCYDLAI